MAKTLLSTILHLLYVIQHITHNDYKNRGQIRSCVVSQLHMPGSISDSRCPHKQYSTDIRRVNT